ncbi:cellulase family glycosylhydrolase [Gordonia sp. VNK1]|uniref:cellulase family glycosylhydrolase n=1 Tax=Gordonia oleivorans TaxID=3156618 RepID=UPI0032B37AB4
MATADVQRLLGAAQTLGVRWVRIGVDWTNVESTRGTYDWTHYDQLINGATAAGFKVLAVIHTTPAWARDRNASGSFHALPANPNDYGRYAGAVADRYGSKVSAWEIWNEPNIIAFSQPAPSVSRYSAMLTAASRAIRAEVRGATIVTAGLAPAGDDGTNIAPTTFIDRLYDVGNRSMWTAVGMHPYTYPYMPDDPLSASWNAYQRMSIMHDTMRANGDGGKKIWMTEFGAPTSGTAGVSEAAQQEALRQAIDNQRSTDYLGPLFVYSLRDSGTNTADVEQNFGLLSSDWSTKPAFATVQGLADSCG